MHALSLGELLQKAQLLFGRSAVGSFIFGLVFGGVPFGIACTSLGIDVFSANLFALVLVLTPVAIVIATVGALLGTSLNLKELFKRTILTSLGECVPLPTVGCTAAALYAGLSVFSPDSLPYLIYLLSLWACAVTFASFIIVALVHFLKMRRSRARL